MAESVNFVTGGTVQAGDGIYIHRNADRELVKLCRQGKFAYVLTPRQMGKSSLMVQTSEQLDKEKIQSVSIDLTQLGVLHTEVSWYQGILVLISRKLGILPKFTRWWKAQGELGITHKFTQFFEEVLLTSFSQKIVIFVDEIDTTLQLDFTDDFFAAIRYFYQARAQQPEFKRLSFVLIGVATPSNLIRDPKRTPFNIGKRVELTDFSFTEALPLADGLCSVAENRQQVLQWILQWTGGHPYLTQRLCEEVVSQNRTDWTESNINELVDTLFLGEKSAQDNNLQFVQDMLVKRTPDIAKVLTTYRNIRIGRREIFDEEQSLIASHLKLSGIVARHHSTDGFVLRVRNLIYSEVFSLAWVDRNLPVDTSSFRLETDNKRQDYFYASGGTVQGGGGMYLTRQADRQLLELCRRGEFSYVLTPRQMGKTSLMLSVAEHLAEAGTKSIMVDLTTIGTQATAEAWFLGFLTVICRQLNLSEDLKIWWKAHEELGLTQRFTQFFEEVIVEGATSSIVIFVDEIDTTLSLDFSDDFFIAIRSFYLSRAVNPKYDQLSFVLLGVATPSDLIRDPQRTPFNIGQRIELTDFTLAEALPLTQGFNLPPDKSEELLKWVLDWTKGHPYLTQQLCKVIAEENREYWTEAELANIVDRVFLGVANRQDNHFQFVRDMLIRRSPDLTAVLETYREVLKKKKSVFDENQSLVKAHLKLSGIVKRENGTLQVRNPIYSEVFGLPWVKNHLPINWMKQLRRAAVTAGIIFFSTTLPLAVVAEMQRQRAVQRGDELEFALVSEENSRQVAEQAQQVAEEQRRLAETERNIAESERAKAEVAQSKAEEAREAEAEQLALAIAAEQAEGQQRLLAESQAKLAEEQTEIAQGEKKRAEQLTVIAEEEKKRAEQQTVIANLRAQTTRALNLLSTPRAVEGLVLAMHATIKSRRLPPEMADSVSSMLESILLQAAEEAKEKMFIDLGLEPLIASLSPDGKSIVNGRRDGSLQLLDVQGNEIKLFEGHDFSIVGVDFSSDGQIITSVDRKGIVKRWNVDGSLQESTEDITFFDIVKTSFSDDGKTIAASLADGSVATQQLASGRWTEWIVNSPLVRVESASLDENDEIVESSIRRTESYEIQGRAGQIIEVYMESEDFEARVTIEDSTGTPLVSTTESTGNGLILRVGIPEDGDYSVIATHSGNEPATGAYRIRIDEVQPIDPPILQEEAILGDGDAVEGSQLQDTYMISGRAGQRLLITMESDNFDTYLRLENSAGEEIASNDDVGNSLNSAIQVSLPNDGVYTIVATRFGGEPHGGEYDLKIQEIIFLNPSILQETVSRLEDGDHIVQRFIRRGDSYPIEGIAGQEIFVRLESEDFDPYLSLQNEFGEELAQGRFSLRATLPADGIYKVVAVSTNGLASGSYDLVINPVPVEGLSVSPKEPLLITALQNGGIQLWDLQGIPKNDPWLEHQSEVLSLDFSPDGQQIVSGGRDRTLRLWNLSTGLTVGDAFRGHGDDVLSVAFSSDGKQIVSGGQDGTLLVWDLQGNSLGEPFRGHSSGIFAVTSNAESQLIMSQGRDGTARLWESNVNVTFDGHTRGIAYKGVAFSPDGQRIVSASYDNTLRLWDVRGDQIGQPFRGHEDLVLGVAFSPDGQRIVSSSADNTLRLWDLQGRQIGQPFLGHKGGGVQSVAFSPDGQRIISAGNDRSIRLWDLQGRQIGQSFLGHESIVSSAVFSPDGQHIVSASFDGTVRLWDLQGRQIGQPFLGHKEEGVQSVAFSPDGQRIISAGSDRSIRLWDLQGRQIGQPFLGHENIVISAVFSPDGQRIASSSLDGTVRLWDSNTGQPIGQPFRGHGGSVHDLAFSPDGQRIVSGGDDGTLVLWQASGASVLEVACDRLRSHPIFLGLGNDYEIEVLEAAAEVKAGCDSGIWEQYSNESITPQPDLSSTRAIGSR